VLGRGGMGKPALACCVLADFEQRKRPGPGGPSIQGITYLHHTPTQPITLDRVLYNISRVLPDEAAEKAERVFGNRDLSTEDRVDRFLDLMPEGLVFALLDNFEDLLDERGRIRDADLNLFVRRALVDQGTLRLLITARAAINLPADELRAERQVTLSDGLPEADAIALLRGLDPNQVIGLATASDAELRELVQKTYGIPHALNLVPNILKGDKGVGLLDGLSDLANDFWVREMVVENLVEVNYRNLRLEARRVAETLAVFARPVPKVAVDFMLQPHMPGLRLDEVLQPLVNARLVYLERGRDGQPTTLGLHRIDRDFLYYRLPTEGSYCRSVLHSRAAAYYRTQRRVGPRGWRDIAELQPQIFECEHLVMAGEYDAAAMLLGEYAGAIAHCGHPTHCRDVFLKLPDQFKSDSARVMYGVAALVWKSYLGPVFEGLKMGEQALQLALAMKDEQLELLVRGELVIAYRYANDSVHSREHAEQIAERAAGSAGTASDAAPLEDVPGFNLVLAYTYQGDVRRAAPLAHQDYELARRSQKPVFIATALNGMAVLYFAWGRYTDAVRFGTEAESVWMPGFHDGIAYVKNILGMSHYLLGDYPAAVAKLEDAITTADEWDSPRPEALAHWNLSLVNLLHGVYDAAARHGREAELLLTRLSLDRTASAPRLAAEAALNKDTAGVVRALLAAAREWTMCGDLFPGTRLAEHAGRLAHAHQLDALAADADALTAELNARIILPLEPPALGA
jgi:tetratricopeptide (TPR) repeat protein